MEAVGRVCVGSCLSVGRVIGEPSGRLMCRLPGKEGYEGRSPLLSGMDKCGNGIEICSAWGMHLHKVISSGPTHSLCYFHISYNVLLSLPIPLSLITTSVVCLYMPAHATSARHPSDHQLKSLCNRSNECAPPPTECIE